MIEMNADPQPLKHYVCERPFDPYSVEVVSPEQEKPYLASQWRMMWLRFKRHRLAVVAAIMGVTAKTVENQLSRSLKALWLHLKDVFE